MGDTYEALRHDWFLKQQKANAITMRYAGLNHNLTKEEQDAITSAQYAWEKLVRSPHNRY